MLCEADIKIVVGIIQDRVLGLGDETSRVAREQVLHNDVCCDGVGHPGGRADNVEVRLGVRVQLFQITMSSRSM